MRELPVTVGTIVMSQITAILHGHRRHVLRHLFPFVRRAAPQTPGPLDGQQERIAPVLHLERGILRFHGAVVLLGRDHRREDLVNAPLLIVDNKVRHEHRGLFHQRIIFLQEFLRIHPTGSAVMPQQVLIGHLQHIDDVRLLPYQERRDIGRTVDRVRGHHLRPAGAAVAVAGGVLPRLGQML